MYVSKCNKAITQTLLPYVSPRCDIHKAAVCVIQLQKTGCNCI